MRNVKGNEVLMITRQLYDAGEKVAPKLGLKKRGEYDFASKRGQQLYLAVDMVVGPILRERYVIRERINRASAYLDDDYVNLRLIYDTLNGAFDKDILEEIKPEPLVFEREERVAPK